MFNISKEDIGIYKCVSKNSLGETESTVRLYGMYGLSYYHTSFYSSTFIIKI